MPIYFRLNNFVIPFKVKSIISLDVDRPKNDFYLKLAVPLEGDSGLFEL